EVPERLVEPPERPERNGKCSSHERGRDRGLTEPFLRHGFRDQGKRGLAMMNGLVALAPRQIRPAKIEFGDNLKGHVVQRLADSPGPKASFERCRVFTGHPELENLIG